MNNIEKERKNLNLKKNFKQLKQRWGIHSNWSILVILVVFAFTGTSALYIADFLSDFFTFYRDYPLYVKIGLRMIIIFPVYQLLLLFFGFIFGHFQFFWEKEKKIFGWLLGWLIR